MTWTVTDTHYVIQVVVPMAEVVRDALVAMAALRTIQVIRWIAGWILG